MGEIGLIGVRGRELKIMTNSGLYDNSGLYWKIDGMYNMSILTAENTGKGQTHETVCSL